MRDVTLPNIDFTKLTDAERLLLLEQVWDTFCRAPDTLPLRDAERRELDRRIAEIDAGTMHVRPWDEVHEEVRRKLQREP